MYTPHPTWEDIHLEAQVQAVLYALRMIKQVLQFIAAAIEIPLPEELLKLTTSLQDLPVLSRLIPSPFELREVAEGVDVEGIMGRLAMLLQEEVTDEDGRRDVKETFTNQTEVAAPTSVSTIGKKKKRKKAKEKKESEVVDKGERNNMFRVLA